MKYAILKVIKDDLQKVENHTKSIKQQVQCSNGPPVLGLTN